jgi:hypothetical protein
MHVQVLALAKEANIPQLATLPMLDEEENPSGPKQEGSPSKWSSYIPSWASNSEAARQVGYGNACPKLKTRR